MERWTAYLMLWLCACASPTNELDGGSGPACTLEVSLGVGDREDFTELEEDDPAELVLGFQGFRMLQLALRTEGTQDPSVDVIAHMSIEDGEQELDQRDRDQPLVQVGDAVGVVEDYLFFVNDLSAASVVGSPATLELIVRSDDCQGTLVRRLQLRDDDECVDFDVVLDAAVPSEEIGDAAVPCEG